MSWGGKRRTHLVRHAFALQLAVLVILIVVGGVLAVLDARRVPKRSGEATDVVALFAQNTCDRGGGAPRKTSRSSSCVGVTTGSG